MLHAHWQQIFGGVSCDTYFCDLAKGISCFLFFFQFIALMVYFSILSNWFVAQISTALRTGQTLTNVN